MQVEIDSKSGFCFGVVYAIEKAEQELTENATLYCLGDIVHNSVEVKRLQQKGLITIDHEQFKNLKNCKVLIRAHGEPPETYKIALQNNITLIDASCPVVLKLQNNIRNGYQEVTKINGQLVIYGKKGHAEVNGLVGQTGNNVTVVENEDDLDKLDYAKPITIYSQTTKSIEGYKKIQSIIKERMQVALGIDDIPFSTNDTICRQVSHRYPAIKEFAAKHDLVLFVSGRKSSNGKVLFKSCTDSNSNSKFITDIDDIKLEWFSSQIKSVGVCGATSTPRWLMEKIAKFIEKI